MSAAPIASLGAVWTAMVDNARASLAAVERGELRASARQQARWRAILANDEMLRRPLRLVGAPDDDGAGGQS